MAWAIVVQGRTDPGRILLIIEDWREAETLAHEIRRKLTGIAVEPYPCRESRPEPPPLYSGGRRAMASSSSTVPSTL